VLRSLSEVITTRQLLAAVASVVSFLASLLPYVEYGLKVIILAFGASTAYYTWRSARRTFRQNASKEKTR
jgi:hypothetical protein